MGERQTDDISRATLRVLSEDDLADRLRDEGARIVTHHGRYWQEVRRGFYEPLHWLARYPVADAGRPARLCWGWRAAVDDPAAANAELPVQLLTRVEDYDISALPSKRRNQLRRGYERCEPVWITGPQLLIEYGYDVMASANERIGFATMSSREAYGANTRRMFERGQRLVLGGVVEGRLGGYLVGEAVGQTAYIDLVFIASDVLSTNIGTVLAFEFVQACRRAGGIKEVVYGLHSREKPELVRFKEGMLFNVVRVPCVARMNPLARWLIRRFRPDQHYRIYGR